MYVNICWSKTNQFGDRVLILPLAEMKGSIFCPVAALRLMIGMVPATASDPLFSILCGKKILPLSYRDYQKMLRYFVGLTGRESGGYSTHSFRRGGATWAFRRNVPEHLIQVLGDWHSDAYKQYLDISVDQRLQVFNLMAAGL